MQYRILARKLVNAITSGDYKGVKNVFNALGLISGEAEELYYTSDYALFNKCTILLLKPTDPIFKSDNTKYPNKNESYESSNHESPNHAPKGIEHT